MQGVPTERLERILSFYKNPFRCLQNCETEYPDAQGTCIVAGDAYTRQRMEHLATPSANWCMFQLSFVAFAEWILEGRFPDLQIGLDEYLDLMKEHMLLVDSTTHVRFSEKIPSDEPFTLSAKLESYRNRGNLWIVKTSYDFAGGKAKGTSKLVLDL